MVKKETSNILIFSAPDSYLIGEPSICSRRAAQRRKMEESASHHVTCGTPLSKRKGRWGAKHSPPNLCPEVETMTNETANEAMLFVILA